MNEKLSKSVVKCNKYICSYLSKVLVTTFDCWLAPPKDFFLGSEVDLGSFLDGWRCLVGASGTILPLPGPPF